MMFCGKHGVPCVKDDASWKAWCFVEIMMSFLGMMFYGKA
jgi:hypothetical protein